jgi:putative mycofactocin binding protein MftB
LTGCVASTKSAPTSKVDVVDESAHLSLSAQVSLRDESFGALAYHHGTRLVFLKSRALVELVRRLGEYESVGAALDELVSSEERARYVTALTSLHSSGLLSG